MTEPHHHARFLEKLEELEAELVHGLVSRLRLARWLHCFPPRLVWATFVFVSGFATIALLALLATAARVPFIFPSLGPTAFLFFFMPTAPSSSPRNTLYGHAIGLACGYAALWLTGLADLPSAMVEGVTVARVLAAALSLAATGAVMILVNAPHPPAGATTLIVSLGIVTQPFHLLIVEVAVACLTLLALAINRLAGLDYPLWAPQARGRSVQTADSANGPDAASSP
jgi:CBS-domain-containing membrane protein